MNVLMIVGAVATAAYHLLPLVLGIVNQVRNPGPPSPPAPSPVTPGPLPVVPNTTRPVIDLIHQILTKSGNPTAQILDSDLQLLRLALDAAGVPPLFSLTPVVAVAAAK